MFDGLAKVRNLRSSGTQPFSNDRPQVSKHDHALRRTTKTGDSSNQPTPTSSQTIARANLPRTPQRVNAVESQPDAFPDSQNKNLYENDAVSACLGELKSLKEAFDDLKASHDQIASIAKEALAVASQVNIQVQNLHGDKSAVHGQKATRPSW